MPARIERQIGMVTVAAGTLAANGVMALNDIPVPSNKKWNVNLVFQSTDGAATRNARLALAGGMPAHGLMSLAASPTMAATSPWAISPAGTYMAIAVSTTRVDLYKRLGLTGLTYIASFAESANVSNLAFSPDERWLAWTSTAFLNVFARSVSDSGFGAVITSPAVASAINRSDAGAGPTAITWSPTGAYIAVGTANAAAAGRVSVFPFTAGAFGNRIDPAGMTVAQTLQRSTLEWAPDESVLAVMYAQNGVSITLYGWPWAAGAPGTVSTKSDAQLGGAGTQYPGVIEWRPDATALILAVMGSVVAGGSPFMSTYVWSAGAWGARQALTNLGARSTQLGVLIWLSSTLVATFLDAGAGGRNFVVDVVSSTGTLVQNAVSQNSATPPAANAATFFFHLNGLLWRTNAAGTALIVECLLAPAVTLFPVVGITANSRQVISGLTFEAGQRLLIGTPANTDVYAVSASAIEIG